MPFPCYYTNSDTKKKYYLTLSTNGKLTEIKAVNSPQEWGSVDWEVAGTQFLLHTIQSHPEKGSGLGSLLMHLAAVEAVSSKCVKMQILSAAENERDFYFLMGCSLDLSCLESFKKEDFSAEEWSKLSSSCPVVGEPAQVVASSSTSVYKRWS